MGKRGDPNDFKGPRTDAMRSSPTPQHLGGQLSCFEHHLHGSRRGNCDEKEARKGTRKETRKETRKNHDICPRLLAAGRYCYDTTYLHGTALILTCELGIVLVKR